MAETLASSSPPSNRLSHFVPGISLLRTYEGKWLRADVVAGLTLANLLALSYLATAIATRGRRSVHDYIAATSVRRAPASDSPLQGSD